MVNNNRERYRNICFDILLLIISFVILIPLYLILINSFKNATESTVLSMTFPKVFQFENYITVFKKANIFRAMGNGILVSSVSVLVVIFGSSMASFILVRRATKLNNFLYGLFIAGLMAPLSIIPTIKVLQLLNIMNTYQGAICIFISVNLPFSVFLFSGFIRSIPKELDESGVIDGCGSMRLFFNIIFPLLKPVIFTCLVLVFMNVWNDFQYTLYFLNKTSMRTMPLTVYAFLGQYTSQWNLVCVDLVLTIAPIIILYVFAQKYIIAGMTAGAVKG